MSNYDILKVSEDAGWDEIEESYRALKEKYGEDRFLEGEAGREGAVNLMELEKAYKELKEAREHKEKQDSYGGAELGDVDELIKKNMLDDAQRVLDKITNRTAKWHFLQSVVFYKRNWYQESRSQLQIAINLDPDNTSYRDSMEKLDKVIASETYRPFDQSQTSAPPPPQMDPSMNAVNCCTTLCCMELCCDLMRCM